MANENNNTFSGIAKTATGTTTNNFVDTPITIDSLGYEKETIIVSNTGLANGLSYKIDVYCHDDGVAFELVPSANIAAGANIKYAVAANETYSKIVISIKAQVAASQTTYQVDYALKGR